MSDADRRKNDKHMEEAEWMTPAMIRCCRDIGRDEESRSTTIGLAEMDALCNTALAALARIGDGNRARPAPVALAGQVEVWPMVIADLHADADALPPALVAAIVADGEERDRIGRERYGGPLLPHNGRNALWEAYEEALDLLAYLRQELAERGLGRAPVQPFDYVNEKARSVYEDAIQLVFNLKRLLLATGERTPEEQP